MALFHTQGPWGKYLALELSSPRNPVEDMCAIVSEFQSAKIGVEIRPEVGEPIRKRGGDRDAMSRLWSKDGSGRNRAAVQST